MTENSLFHIEMSGKISQNTFLMRQQRTSETSPFCQVRKVFLAYFSRNQDMNAIYHVCLTFELFFGHFCQTFVVRKSRSRKVRQKCPEKQDKKSLRDMIKCFTGNLFLEKKKY